MSAASALEERLLPQRLGRQFRRVLLAFWVSNIGDGIGLAAAPLLIASYTRNPAIVALAPLLQQLPWLLFGLQAGAIADRVDRRRLLLVSNFARAAVIIALGALVAADLATVSLILVAVFLFGVAETFVDTVASTMLPMLVDPGDIGIGNNRLTAGHVMLNQLVGPPLGAALFALGASIPFTTQGVLVVAAGFILLGLQLPEIATDPDREPTHIRADIAAGVRWLWAHGAVRTLALVMFAFNVTFGASWSMIVLYAQDRLHLDDIGYGLLATFGAVGGLMSAGVYDWLERRFALSVLMKVCLSLEVFVHLFLATSTRPWMGFAIMFGFGAYAHVWSTVSNTVRQRAVPDEFQGRVAGVYLVGLFGGLVFGSALGAGIAHVWGITGPFWFATVGTAAILAIVWRQLPLIAHAGEVHPAETDVVAT